MSRNVYLAEIVAATNSAGTLTTLRYSSDHFTSAISDSPPNTYYAPRIKQPALMRRDVFDAGRTFGASRVGYGELVLANPDGDLDALIDYGFDVQACTLRLGLTTATYPGSFTTLLVGTVEQPEFSNNEVTFRMRDKQMKFDRPFQTTLYSGNNALPNGLEGVSDDLKGKPKSKVYGAVFNVSPPCVNTSRLIYETGVCNSIVAVYDRGAALTVGSNYVSQADMEAVAPPASNFRSWVAGGYFRLGSSPAGLITTDIQQGANAAARTVGQIMNTVALNVVSASDISSVDVTSLDNADSSVVGIWVAEERTHASVMDELCGTPGAWWGFDRLGVLRMKQLLAPSGTSVASFSNTELFSINRISAASDPGKGLPIWKIKLNYYKNYTVQNNDLAGSVTDVRRQFLANEFRTVTAVDSNIINQHLLAPSYLLDTLYTVEANAQTEATRRLNMYKVRRDLLEIRVHVDETTMAAVDLGSVVTVTTSRFGYSSGKQFAVLGIEPNYAANILNLSLWG